MQRRCAFWRTSFFMHKSLGRTKPLRGWRQPLWLAYIAAGAATQRKTLPVAVMVEKQMEQGKHAMFSSGL